MGPGVRRIGRTGEVFSDHTDIRPTLVSLAGLRDDYVHDGRVLSEILSRSVLPSALRSGGEAFSDLANAYKAINASLGELGRRSLRISTAALRSDATAIDALDGRLNELNARRNALAGRMIAMLEGAAFDNQPIDRSMAEQLIGQAEQLLESVDE